MRLQAPYVERAAGCSPLTQLLYLNFKTYLADDLRETKGLAEVLLPTYFEQAKAFPLLLQEAALRGTAGKVDLLFLEEYYHARASCPANLRGGTGSRVEVWRRPERNGCA